MCLYPPQIYMAAKGVMFIVLLSCSGTTCQTHPTKSIGPCCNHVINAAVTVVVQWFNVESHWRSKNRHARGDKVTNKPIVICSLKREPLQIIF